jgi:hypothetical protein
MKKITNLEDLRYRKLYLRSEIKFKEQKIGNQLTGLREDINTVNFKNEIMQSAMRNPALVINIARLAYGLFFRLKKQRKKRKSRGKSRKS